MVAEKLPSIDKESWEPKTEIGRLVKKGEITSIEEIENLGKPILEPEIVDVLLPRLESETLLIKTTQRTTDSGRKIQFRVVVVVGDRNGHVGLGVGKSDEVKPALEYAIRDAKKNIISFKRGCGSWECKCPFEHSIPRASEGKEGTARVVLKPAPRGLGLAANDTIKKVLSIAGVKDVWSTTIGNTSNVYNTALATIKAIKNLTHVKPPVE